MLSINNIIKSICRINIYIIIIFVHIITGYVIILSWPLLLKHITSELSNNIILFLLSLLGLTTGYLMGLYFKKLFVLISVISYLVIIIILAMPWIFFIFGGFVTTDNHFPYLFYPILGFMLSIAGSLYAHKKMIIVFRRNDGHQF